MAIPVKFTEQKLLEILKNAYYKGQEDVKLDEFIEAIKKELLEDYYTD